MSRTFATYAIIGNLMAIVLANTPVAEPILSFSNQTLVDNVVNYRLPNTTHPVSYDLSIKSRIDQGAFDFSGNVKIEIVVDQNTREIVLHTRQLTILNVKLGRYFGPLLIDLALEPLEYEPVPELLKIRTAHSTLRAGDCLLLHINYNGTLRTDWKGFHRNSYVNSAGVTTWLAITEADTTDARHAFPCYDEPAFKARFRIKITHGQRYNAISNMPESRVENRDGTATTSFGETPLASTYTIAFVISDLPFATNTKRWSKVQHRLFAQPSKISLSNLALDTSVQLLPALERYLGVEYSFSKIDQLAIPNMGFGGSANWGLITTSEPQLLWKNNETPFWEEWNMVIFMSHRLSQQFFASLVSPKSWDTLWLNKGFACLLQYIGTDLVRPDWNILEYYAVYDVQNTLSDDSSISNNPMTTYTDSPESIARKLDRSTFTKPGSVLRMFLYALTENTFKKGLKEYLQKNSYKSVDEWDLFASLDKVAKQDGTLDTDLSVADLFSTWSNQKGYPLLIVDRNYSSNRITLKQEHHLSPVVATNDSSTWWIPFNFASASNRNFNDTTPMGWMRDNETQRTLHSNGRWEADDWVIFNKQQTSYYRIQYDDTNYEFLAKQLKSSEFESIHVLNRAQLLHDLGDFAFSGRVNVTILLEFLSYLQNEKAFAPWATAERVLLRLKRLLAGAEYNGAFREFVANITDTLYESVGLIELPSDSFLHKASRNIAVNLACGFGHKKCLFDIHKRFKQIIIDWPALSPNTSWVTIPNGVRSATPCELEILWYRLFITNNEEHRSIITTSLGRITPIGLLKEYLNRTLVAYDDETGLAGSGWRWSVFRSAAQNGQNSLSACIELVHKQYENFAHFYQLTDVYSLVLELADLVFSDKVQNELEQLLNFLRSRGLIQQSNIEAVSQLISDNRRWTNDRSVEIESWLNNPDRQNPTNKPATIGPRTTDP